MATEAAPLFATATKRSELIESIVAVAAACKCLRSTAAIETYNAFLTGLATALSKTPMPDQAIALAFAIEQSPAGALAGKDFTTICRLAAENCHDLRYNNDNNIGERWTVILPAQNAPAIEISPLDEAAAARGVGAVAALMLWAKRNDLVETMGKRKWQRLSAEFSVLTASVAQANDLKLPAYIANKETPAVLAQMVDPSEEQAAVLPLFVNDDFFAHADRNVNTDNRCTMLVMMELHTGLFVNFTRGSFRPATVTKARVEFMGDLFGLRLKDGGKNSPSQNASGDSAEYAE